MTTTPTESPAAKVERLKSEAETAWNVVKLREDELNRARNHNLKLRDELAAAEAALAESRKKTRGQVVALQMVPDKEPETNRIYDYRVPQNWSEIGRGDARYIRRYIATAIDAELAAHREACAAAVRKFFENYRGNWTAPVSELTQAVLSAVPAAEGD